MSEGMIFVGISPHLDATSIVAISESRAIYRGTIRPARLQSEAANRLLICADILECLTDLQPDRIVIEECDVRNPRTRTDYAIRLSLLIGQLLGSVTTKGFAVTTASLPIIERGLRIATDKGRERATKRLKGVSLHNESERIAALAALFGERFPTSSMEMTG